MRGLDVDVVIVGQGLVGSALAWRLVSAGRRVWVIDDGHRSSASRVAAGLINPLAGMRFNRRPEVDRWLEAAGHWYDDIERLLGGPVFFPRPMLRLFRSEGQARFYVRRRADPASQALLGRRFGPDDCPEPVAAPHGGFMQFRTGHVAMPRLLDRLAAWLRERESLEIAALDPAEIEPGADGVQVGSLTARHLVFCDGARLVDNPWFADLPLSPEKGEILTLESPAWRPRHLVNGAHWLVPGQDGRLRFGATHDHGDRSPGPTAEAGTTLRLGLEALVPGHDFAIIDQQAGLRPSTPDRYPLIGRHRRWASLYVCNGFGARGALTAPWYARCLAGHLVDGRPLPAEADIARFFERHG
jgi:glycine/D-amino acid oxidase-like deaminating enzyme